ncbi:hypothetical protein [Stenotrophomonas acidaminiphila]
MAINMFTPHDFVSKLIGRLKGKKVEGLQTQYINETIEQFQRLTDKKEKFIPSRNLVNVFKKHGDEDTLTKLGAVQNDDGEWIVPDNIELNDSFKPWYPMIPKDLDDEHVSFRITRDGLQWEKFVDPEEPTSSEDSSATPIVMGMFPVFAALTLFGCAAMAFLGVFGAILGTVLVLGSFAGVALHATALWRGEDWQVAFGEAFKGYLVPLCVSLYVMAIAFATGGVRASSQVLNLVPSSVPTFAREFVITLVQAASTSIVLVGVSLVVLFLWNIINFSSNGYGGFFEAYRQSVRSSFGVIAAVFFALIVPVSLAPAVILVFSCLRPVMYTEASFKARAIYMHQQDRIIGGLGTHSEFEKRKRLREKMLNEAMADETPLIAICVPTGYMVRKQLRNAPDAGNMMMQSIKDLLKHTLVFGKTGVGKTQTTGRNVTFQLAKLAARGYPVGLLALCGKGAFPADIEPFLDYNIKPGIAVGLLEGLTPQDVALALNNQRDTDSSKGDAFWQNAAAMCCTHLCEVAGAMTKQEQLVFERFKRDIDDECMLVMINQANIKSKSMKIVKDNPTSQQHLQNQMLIAEIEELKVQTALSEQRQKFASDYLAKGKQWAWTFQNLVRVKTAFLNGMKKVVVNGEETYKPIRLMADIFAFLGVNVAGYPDTKFPAYPDLENLNSDIIAAITYWQDTWCPMPDDTRGSVASNVNILFDPLSKATNLVDENGEAWISLEKGVDITGVLKGQRIGLALKEEIYGDSGRVVAILLKQRVYTETKKRALYSDKWDKHLEGHVNLFVFMDEAHILVGKEEREFASVSRSSGLGFFFMAQDYNSFHSSFGGNIAQTSNFLDLPQSVLCYECSSHATYEWVEKRVGKGFMSHQDPSTFGLDYAGAYEKSRTSILNMEDHPTASFNKELKNLGMMKVVAKALFNNSDQMRDQKWNKLDGTNVNSSFAPIHTAILAGSTGTLKEDNIVSATELNEELRDSGYSRVFVLLHRAGSSRIDFAEPLGMPNSKMAQAKNELIKIAEKRVEKNLERLERLTAKINAEAELT